jgi:uncharacterized protein YfaS (alpha-2-macroglobulin family)
MRGDPLANETINFFLEGADGTLMYIGKVTTDKSGRAEFNYKVDADAGTYWIIASYDIQFRWNAGKDGRAQSEAYYP